MKAWIALLAIGLDAGVAVAAEPDAPPTVTPPGGDRPWAVGVPEESQRKALELFNQGTELLKDSFFTKAVEQYREALKYWDHPAIHFNLSKALMNLDQPVDAYNHLNASLKYGGAPLNEDQIDQVKRYMKLLYSSELAELVIEAKEPDAVVSLDGTELFKAPGKWSGIVRADKHTILATKPGFQPAQEQPVLEKGQKTEIMLTLVPMETVTKYETLMDKWKPWVVFGSGAAVLITGGIFTWQSSEQFAAYDQAIEVCNAESAISIVDDRGVETGGTITGCRPTAAINDKKSSAETFQTLATVSYIVGGATLATGVVMLILNRERPIKVDIPVEEVVEPPVSVVPMLGPDGGGVSATLRF